MAQFAVVATLDKTIEADTSQDSRVGKCWGTIAVPAYAAAAATTTLTSDGKLPLDGSKLLIGPKTYTLKTALSSPAVANEILIDVSAAAFLDNLAVAIDAGAGGGTKYSTGTLANTSVVSGTNADTTQVLNAGATGTAGNLLMTRSTDPHLTFPGANLTGGRAATTYVTASSGFTLNLAGVIPSGAIPIEVKVWSDTLANAWVYRFVRGTTLANGKVFIFVNAGTLAGPLVELGNSNQSATISGDTKLRFKAYYQTGK